MRPSTPRRRRCWWLVGNASVWPCCLVVAQHLAMTVLSFYSEDVAGLLRYRVCHHVLKAMVVNILDTFVQVCCLALPCHAD